MTAEAWVMVLGVACAGLLVMMLAAIAHWADARHEVRRVQVARFAERAGYERQLEVLRQAVEQTHGRSPMRATASDQADRAVAS